MEEAADPPAEEEKAEEPPEEGETQEAEEESAEPVVTTKPVVFKPRVFKVYKGGEAIEFIDEDAFKAIKKKAESRGDQHISERDIHNSETNTVPISHTFLSESDMSGNKGIVVAFNIAGESQAPRALQTLTVPSAITFAYVGSHSVPLPMISAIPSDADTYPDTSKILLVRQVQEFPKLEDKQNATIEEVKKDLSEFDLVNEDTSPSTYMVSETHVTGNSNIREEISAISEKIMRLRKAKAAFESKKESNQSEETKPKVRSASGAARLLVKEVM